MPKLVVKVDMCSDEFVHSSVNWYEARPSEWMTWMLKTHRKEVMEFLDSNYPGKDWYGYECGIDSWWGIGSVFAYELGLRFTLEIPPYEQAVILTISN